LMYENIPRWLQSRRFKQKKHNMKKLVLGLLPAALLFSVVAFAQSEKTTKKEKKEIVIQKNENGKKEKMVIVINDGEVTINGKPAAEYKGNQHIVIDGDIVINGSHVRVPGKNRSVSVYDYQSNKPMLGVVTEKNDKGAAVKEVVNESAAEKAGIKEGDIITKLNTNAIASHEDLVAAIAKLQPNDVADIALLRNGKEVKLKATLGKSNSRFSLSNNLNYNYSYNIEPPLAMAAPRPPKAPRAPRAFNWNDDNDLWIYRSDRPKYGMSIEDYADGDGVKITDVENESNAQKAGLKQNDVITEVDGNAIKGTDQLKEALSAAKDKTSISVKVLRNGAAETITIKVPKVIKKADL
jgi:serine protease Do